MAFRRHRTGDSALKRSGKKTGGKSDLPPATAQFPESAGQRLFKRALKILAARPRSEAQLRERLLAVDGADSGSVDECLERLKALGYIDDKAFAESYVNYRISARPLGRHRLARELARTGVDREAVNRALEEAFEETREEALIDRAIARRRRAIGPPTDRRSARRWFDHLMRLGFDGDLIARKLREMKD